MENTDRIAEAIAFHDRMLVIRDGKHYFLDPLTGDLISPTKPPHILDQDPTLSEGFRFLEQFGNCIDLEMVLWTHVDDPASLGDDTYGFEKRVQSAQVVLLEGLGWTPTLREELNRFIRDGNIGDELQSFLQKRSSRRIADALRGHDVLASFADIDRPTDRDDLRELLIATSELPKIIEQATGDEENKRRALALHVGAFEAIREWFIVGMVGKSISQLATQDSGVRDALARRQLKVCQLLGRSHEDVLRKLRTYGVRVNESPVPGEVTEGNKDFPRWMAQGFIPQKDLE